MDQYRSTMDVPGIRTWRPINRSKRLSLTNTHAYGEPTVDGLFGNRLKSRGLKGRTASRGSAFQSASLHEPVSNATPSVAVVVASQGHARCCQRANRADGDVLVDGTTGGW